jgi:hypothetical protein
VEPRAGTHTGPGGRRGLTEWRYARHPTQEKDMSKSTTTFVMHERERRPVVNPFLAGRRRGWWDTIAQDALVDDALVYVELEDEATKVRTFKIDLVDGLLQTPEYAAAVIRANRPHGSDALVRSQVDARTRRQARLHGPDPIHVEAIITEGALRIQVGDRETMRRQIDHLLRVAELPNVDLRVVPATGAYPGLGTPFYILSIAGSPDVCYVELFDKGLYLEEPDDVELYVTRFTELRAVAWDPERSRTFMATLGSGRA